MPFSILPRLFNFYVAILSLKKEKAPTLKESELFLSMRHCGMMRGKGTFLCPGNISAVRMEKLCLTCPSLCSATFVQALPPFPFLDISPKIKSFRKGDGGAGEEGKPFFKRVSLFPRITQPFLTSSAKPQWRRAGSRTRGGSGGRWLSRRR